MRMPARIRAIVPLMPDAKALRFSPDWSETITLADGRRVRFRLLRPGDAAKLQEGLSRLSERSRYLRFFTDKARLSDAELAYLTEIDQHDHFAIAAALLEDDGSEGPGVAIGRFVRLADEADVADPAVAVVDELQGNGIGRRLMTWLIAAAAERGVRRFRTEFLAVNAPMRQLLVDLSKDTRFEPDGPVVVAEFPLPGAAGDLAIEASPQYVPLATVLRLVAEQAIELVEARFSELLDPQALRARVQRWASRLRVPEGRGPAPDDPDAPSD
jgi:GNAT superfamily N-acetyltransferase